MITLLKTNLIPKSGKTFIRKGLHFVSVKAVIIFIFVLGSVSAKAQFAVAMTDIITNNSDIGNGFISRSAVYGSNVMCGVGYNTFSNGLLTPSPMMIYTNQDGAVLINNTYQFADPISGNPLSIKSTRIIELADGSGYIAVSAFELDRTSNPKFNNKWYGLLHMEFDLSFNLVFTKKYVFPANNAMAPLTPTGINISSLKQLTVNNPQTDEFVAVGQVLEGEETQIYILKFDRNGVTHWGGGRTYNFNSLPQNSQEMPTDIIESPFTPTSFPRIQGLLHVVGYADISGQGRDPFIFTVNPVSGSGINQARLNNFGGFDAFTQIIAVTNGNNPGFVISGYSHTVAFNNGDAMVTKMDLNMNHVWTHTYEDNTDPSNVFQANSVSALWDGAAGTYTYWAGGSRNASQRDAISFVLDEIGIPVTGMYYRDLGSEEYAVNIDVEAGVGVRLYGRHFDATSTPYCLLYWACDNDLPNVETPANWAPYQTTILHYGHFDTEAAINTNIINNNDYQGCQAWISQGAPSNTGHSEIQGQPGNLYNYKGINKQNNSSKSDDDIPQVSGLSIYPNPATDRITLELSKDIANDALITVELKNILGQSVKTIYEGEVNNSVDILLPILAPGIYIVQVHTGTNLVLKTRLVINK